MTLRRKALVRAKRAVRHMTPGHVVKSRLARRAVADFADKVGMVYFGYVDQQNDDHRLIRGHTVSKTHVDTHYAVGSLRDYDVAFVTREDTVRVRSGKDRRYHWLICTIDLHARLEVPNLYIGHYDRSEAYQASYEQLRLLDIGNYAQYPPEFLQHYAVYGIPGDILEIEQAITPQVASVIASHFKNTSIEIEDNTIYLYIESQHPTQVLLEKVLSNGLWLAEAIDTAYTPQMQAED